MAGVIGSSSLANINQSPANTSKAASGSADLQNNFMTLLITQLKNQDPLKPLENAELTSQLAQINTVSGIEELNKTMSGITSQIDMGQQLQASQLIGRGVLVPGNRVLVGNGESTPFGVELAQGSQQVSLSIVSSSGEVVRQYELGELTAGIESFHWDGKKSDGSVAADGAYTIQFKAVSDGKEQPVTALNYGLVSGVGRSEKGVMLDLGGLLGRVPVSAVREVI